MQLDVFVGVTIYNGSIYVMQNHTRIKLPLYRTLLKHREVSTDAMPRKDAVVTSITMQFSRGRLGSKHLSRVMRSDLDRVNTHHWPLNVVIEN